MFASARSVELAAAHPGRNRETGRGEVALALLDGDGVDGEGALATSGSATSPGSAGVREHPCLHKYSAAHLKGETWRRAIETAFLS